MNEVTLIRRPDLPFLAVQGDGASGLQLARLYQNPNHSLTFQLARIEAGGVSKRHQHPWEQINWVVSGTGQVEAGEQTIEIGPGDCVVIPGDTPHAITNNDDKPLMLVAVLGPGAP